MQKFIKFNLFGFYFLLACIFFNNAIAYCDENINAADSIKSDSTKFITSEEIASTSKNNSKNIEMTKSPMGAIWRSLVLPGWGQFYVESYWKIPIFSGGVIASTYFIIDNQNKYSKKQKEIDDYLAIDENNFGDNIHTVLKNQREVYRDNRDISIFVLAGFYIVAAVDSYVGAHLFDFNVSDDIGLNIQPNINTNLIGINFTVNFFK